MSDTKVSDATAKASDTVGQVQDAAKDAAERIAGAAHQVYGKARESAADLGGKIPEAADETLRAGRRAYARGSESLERQVTRQPIEALLLAGAIGYLVGWAANRS